MIYYNDGEILVRNMTPPDAYTISEAEMEQGWNASPAKYEARLRDHAQGKVIALTAEYRGRVAGYISLYLKARSGPYAGKGIPEIVDFGVLEKYRKRGIGTRLMDIAEEIAADFGDAVCLGVGLHSGYGSAQRMYIKRGYVPDGSGVWYDDRICEPYAECINDDDLVLYMAKRFK